MRERQTDFLIDRLWRPGTGRAEGLRVALLALGGSLLLWAAAKVQVPFWPVPMTLQTAAVFLIGLAYGPRLGLVTVALYLAEGAAGLPVFAGTPAKGLGLAYMLGPTGGYLLGFLAAAWIAGLAAERRLGPVGTALVLLVASAALYLPGLAWLATFVGPARALQLGLVPFIPGDLLKLALVVTLWQALPWARAPRGES